MNILQIRSSARGHQSQLDAAAIGALFSDERQRNPEQAVHIALSDSLIAELQAADTLVLGFPGLTDVEFNSLKDLAEGLTMGTDAERQAYAEASAQIRDAVERSMPVLEAEAA